jgi:hypothetical protein
MSISFHPRAGISEGLVADRPRPSSATPRVPVNCVVADGRRPKPLATSSTVSPIGQIGARFSARDEPR